MEFLTRFGIDRSRFTIFVMVIVLLMGLAAYFDLSKREDPAITIRTAVVSAYFPGMSPERIENLIVDPLERTARQVSEIEDIKTLITTGSAVIYLDVYDAVPGEELERVFQDVRNRMNAARPLLPAGTDGPHVDTDYGDVVIASIAVTGNGYSYAELEASAKALRKKLYAVKGIGKVSLLGVQKERIWLDIDSRKLASIGVQLPQLFSDLQAQNVILSAGDIDAEGSSIILEANGDLNDVEAIENVLTQVSGSGDLVRLRDLLNVRRGYEEPRNNPVYFNGQPAIMLGVEMSDGQDIQVMGRRLKEAVSPFEQTQPVGMTYNFSTYQEVDVTTAINSALSNVAQTAGVVLIVLMIFLGLRPALIVACIVPFTVMFAIILMGFMGVELHVVSIAAVIISLGLLVDNGLVIVEDIQGQISSGIPPNEAALATSRQFGTPLAVASITTVAAFIPLFLVDGDEGEYGFALGAVVALMLIGSWLTAMYILPALSVWFSKNTQQTSTEAEPSALIRIYEALLKKSMPLSIIVVIGSYVLVVASSMLFGSVKNEMFPLSARSQYLIYMDMPKGTSIQETERNALAIEKWLSDQTVNPEVKNSTMYIGDGGPRFYLALNPADTNPSSAFILVNTHDFEGAVVAANRARSYLYEEFPTARAKVKHLSMGGSESGIVEVKITGPDPVKLLQVAKQLEAQFSTLPNIIQNENDWGNKVIKAVIDIAQDKAREHGVTSRDISIAMDSYISGATVSQYREGNKSIPIVARGIESYRDSIEDLVGITVPVNGALVSLEQVATFVPTFEFSQVRRENQQRMIKVSAKSTDMSAFDMVDFIQPTLDEMDWSGGYSYEFDGEIEESKDINGKLATGMIPGVIIMFAAIMFQFNSMRRVTLIFLTIPLILIGSPIALLATGQPLSFFATLGLISLAGIIINNAIVLIDQIDIESQSLALKEAIIVAAKKRITPISLTTLTTVVGLLPMAIAGGALFEPMATLMIGGLLLASAISLFFVPSAFYLFFKGNKELNVENGSEASKNEGMAGHA